jgi:hypothetical protein
VHIDVPAPVRVAPDLPPLMPLAVGPADHPAGHRRGVLPPLQVRPPPLALPAIPRHPDVTGSDDGGSEGL